MTDDFDLVEQLADLYSDDGLASRNIVQLGPEELIDTVLALVRAN